MALYKHFKKETDCNGAFITTRSRKLMRKLSRFWMIQTETAVLAS